MNVKTYGLAACAAIILAGCASNNQGTSAHRLSVELVGAESADCISPQAVGDYAIEAPGEFLVEPEEPTVEIICNAEGFQETYASFEEVYNDGSAGAIALGALAGGLMGAAIMSGQDGLDSLPNRVTITLVPDGETAPATLATANYDKASEAVLPVTSLAAAYTLAEPPEDSELAAARAEAEANSTPEEREALQQAKLRQFEARLKGSKPLLTDLLNRYNQKAEFARSSHTGVRLKIKDVSRIDVLEAGDEGYVVRILGNSGMATSFNDEVYDEHFLIDDRRGGLRIMAHGKRLVSSTTRAAAANESASGRSAGDTDLERFEDRLKASRSRLKALLNDYNQENTFTKSGFVERTLVVRDISKISVISARSDGYVVRLSGNSSSLGASRYDAVYDELFLIEDRRGGLRIMAHGKQLVSQARRAAAQGENISDQPVAGADIKRFKAKLEADKSQLTQLLDDYNKKVEFTRSYQRALKVSEMYEIEVLGARGDEFVVRVVGNSTAALPSLHDVFDELFLIENRRGA